MYEFIKGKIIELTPAYAVIEASGIGYFINITLNSYTQLQEHKEGKLYLHLNIREDAHVLYGFTNSTERLMFRLLISVSGVGPNTARMMLSSMPASEVKRAISEENVNMLKSIKGIGAKSAQRIIVDLKDKIEISFDDDQIVVPLNNTLRNEALSAMEVLGFSKKLSEKAIDKIIASKPDISIEELIKQALKVL